MLSITPSSDFNELCQNDLSARPGSAACRTDDGNFFSDGKKINRFCHLHQSTEDLVKKVKMQRLLGQQTAACFQRCVGMDAINAVDSTTFEMDKNWD